MSSDLCDLFYSQMYYCMHPTDPSPSNNVEFFRQGLNGIVTNMIKIITLFLNPQVQSNDEQLVDHSVFENYQNSPEYVKILNRYFLGVKTPMDALISTLIIGTKNVFDSLFASLSTYLFAFGLIVSAFYAVLIGVWIMISIKKLRLLRMALTFIPKDLL